MASDYLLEIDGIKGEATDERHPGSLEIESFSWGLTNVGSSAGGSGGGVGRSTFQDIHFTKSVDKASPQLFLSCAKGEHIKKATLFVRKAGGQQTEYYTVQLDDVLISDFKSGGANNAVPMDEFSMNFGKITFTVRTQGVKGDSTPVSASWDLKANKAT